MWVGCRHNEKKAFTHALSWLSETWKISIVVKNETTVDAHCGYVKLALYGLWPYKAVSYSA